jgi:hypothetical protein
VAWLVFGPLSMSVPPARHLPALPPPEWTERRLPKPRPKEEPFGRCYDEAVTGPGRQQPPLISMVR